jgi:hypothetical protein
MSGFSLNSVAVKAEAAQRGISTSNISGESSDTSAKVTVRPLACGARPPPVALGSTRKR